MASASETDNYPNGPTGNAAAPLSVANENTANASENLKNGLTPNSNATSSKQPPVVGYPNMPDHNNVANPHPGGPPPDMNNSSSQPSYPAAPGGGGPVPGPGPGSGPQNNGHHPMDAPDPKHWTPGNPQPNSNAGATPGGYESMPYGYNRPYEPSSYMHSMPSHNNVPDIANSFPFSQYSSQPPRSPYGPVASKPMAYLNTTPPRPGPGSAPPPSMSSYAPGYPPHHQPRYMGGPPAPHHPPPTPTLNQLLQNQRYPGPPLPGHHPPPQPPSSNAYASAPGPATDYPPKDTWMQHRMPYSQQPMYRQQDVQEPIENSNSGTLNATPNLSGRGSPAPNSIAPPPPQGSTATSTPSNSLPSQPPQPATPQQQTSTTTPTVVRPAPSPTGSTGSNSRSMSPAIGQGNVPMPPRPSSSQSDSSGQPPRMSQSPMATQSAYQASMPPPPHMGVYANKMAPVHPGLSPYPPSGQYPPTVSSGAGAYMPRPPTAGYPAAGGVPAGYPNQPPMGSPSQGTPSPSPGPPQGPPNSAQSHPQPGAPYPNRPLQQYPPYPGPPVNQYPPQQGWGVPGPPPGPGSMPSGKGGSGPQPPPSHQQAMTGSGPGPLAPTGQQASRPHTPPHPYLKQHLQQKMGGYGHPPGPGPGGQPPQPPHGHPPGQGPPPMMSYSSTGMLSPNMASHGQHPPAASSPGMGGGPVTSLVTTGPDGAALDEASQQSTLSNASAASGDEAPSTPRSRKENSSVPNVPSAMSHGHAPPPPSQSQSHPTTPQSTVPSPGAASMTGSAQEDYADLNSPGNQGSWSRAPASPVFNHTTGTDPYKHKKSGSGDSLSRLYEFDDNPERRVFLDRLLRFMEDKGAPITACPTISKNPLDLYRLYHLVRERGGFVEVTKNKAWKDIAGILGIGASSSAAYTLRKHYTKNLLPWECKYDRGGIDPQPIINQVESSTKKKGNKGISVPSPGSSNSQDSFPTGGSNTMDGYYGYPSGEYGTAMLHRGPPQQGNMNENVAVSNPFEDHQAGGAYSRQPMNNNYPNMYANNMPGRPPGMPSNYGPTPPQPPYYGPVNHEYPGQTSSVPGGPPPGPQHPPPPPNATTPQLSHGPPSGPPAPQPNQAYPPAPGYPPPPRTVYPPYPQQEDRPMYAPPQGPPPTSAPPAGTGPGPDPYGRYVGPQYTNAGAPVPGARPPPQAAPSPAPSSPAPPSASNPPSQPPQQPQPPAPGQQPQPPLSQPLPQPQQSLQPPGLLAQPSSPAARPPASPAPMPPAAASPAPPMTGTPTGAGPQPPQPPVSTSGPATANSQAPYPPQEVYQADPYQRTGLRQLLASPPSQSTNNHMLSMTSNQSSSSTSNNLASKSPLAQQLAGNHSAAQGYPGSIPAPGTPPSQPPFMGMQAPAKGTGPPPTGAAPRPPNPQQPAGTGQPSQQQPPFAPYGQPRQPYDRGNGSGYMYGAPFNPSEAWRGGSPYGSPQYPPQGSSPGPATPSGPQSTPPPWAQTTGPPAPPPQASSPARPMQPSQWAEQQQRYQAQQQQQQTAQPYPPQQGQNTWNMGSPMRGPAPRPTFRPDAKGYPMSPSPAVKGPMGQMISTYGATKPVPMFPLDSTEAVSPILVKRRRLNKSDVSPVDPWRLFLALKSGLLAETTWALDTLNILLFDDSSVAYFGLNYLPGLLEVLLDHFRRTLYDMFGILEDMEWNREAANKKRKSSAIENGSNCSEMWWQRTGVRGRGKLACIAPADPDSANPVEDLEPAESDLGQVRPEDLVGDKVIVLEQPYIPWSVRHHPSVKIVPREDDIFVSDRVKAWDVFEKKTFEVNELGVDDLSHIRTKFEAELGVVPFVRVLRDETKNQNAPSETATAEEEVRQRVEYEEQGSSSGSQGTLGMSSPSSHPVASDETTKKANLPSLQDTKKNCVKKARCLADVLSRIKKEPVEGEALVPEVSDNATLVEEESPVSKNEEPVAMETETSEKNETTREDADTAVTVSNERIRDPHGILKRRRVDEYEDECLMRDEPSLCLFTDTQDSLAKRCLCIATIIRNLTFVPGNEASFSRNATFLTLAGKLLLLHHEHPLRSTKQRNYDREDEVDYSDSCTSLHEPEWWWDALIVLREHILVILANISGQLDLSLYPEEITRPILDGLLHYAVCSSAQVQDPLPAYGPYSLSLVSWQRLSLEALCKLCVMEVNTDLILATPPFERLEKLVAFCGRSICRTEDQVLREFSINLLFYLAAADSGMAHVLANSGNTLTLLVAFIEQAEASALAVASQHGLQALRESPESMGTSLDMLRRAAHILYYVAQHPVCRPLVGKLEPRLLALVMSQIMDQGVAAVLARALYLCTASPDNKC